MMPSGCTSRPRPSRGIVDVRRKLDKLEVSKFSANFQFGDRIGKFLSCRRNLVSPGPTRAAALTGSAPQPQTDCRRQVQKQRLLPLFPYPTGPLSRHFGVPSPGSGRESLSHTRDAAVPAPTRPCERASPRFVGPNSKLSRGADADPVEAPVRSL